MPTLHLTKVAFGCRTLEALQKRVAMRARDGEVRVVTRMRPKRMDELVGGSLHWIVKHRIIARQQILRFEDRSDGRIDIVCSADLVIVPGSKSTVHDLEWLRAQGLDHVLSLRARREQPVLGICGGCQMLGETIRDEHGVESREREVMGLGLLPLATEFGRRYSEQLASCNRR